MSHFLALGNWVDFLFLPKASERQSLEESDLWGKEKMQFRESRDGRLRQAGPPGSLLSACEEAWLAPQARQQRIFVVVAVNGRDPGEPNVTGVFSHFFDALKHILRREEGMLSEVGWARLHADVWRPPRTIHQLVQFFEEGGPTRLELQPHGVALGDAVEAFVLNLHDADDADVHHVIRKTVQ